MVSTQVERMREILSGLKSGGTGSTDGATTTGTGADHLSFDDAADRLAFPERTGSWSVIQGAIVNSSDGALARDDCGNANWMATTFVPKTNSGGLTINFRGLRVVVDLTAQSYLVTSPDQRTDPTDFPFLGNTQYQIYIALEADGEASVQINQTDPIQIKAQGLSSRCSLTVDTGAEIAVDEIEIRRGDPAGREPTRVPGVDPAHQQVLRDVMGLVPLGGAHKDPGSTAIVLPRIAGGRSGIAVPLDDRMKGVTFRVGGQDALAVGIGTVDDTDHTADGPFYEVQLPPAGDPPLEVKATWTDQHLVLEIGQVGAETTVHEIQLPDERTHLFIRATLAARLPTSPKILR